jgi:phage baseplate assembly protein W
MYSIGFPEMVGGNTTRLVKDKDAVKSNMMLLLSSEKATLFGDPYFGTSLRQAIFEQPNSLIADLLIDEIYTAIITYIPQVFLTRKDITISSDNTDLFAEIRYTYIPDNTSDLHVMNLTNGNSV